MDINAMTIGQGRELVAIFGYGQAEAKAVPFEIGMAYFFRTVTYHITGRVISVVGDFLILEDAAWIAASGRFSPAMQNGELAEVEPFKQDARVYLNWSSITDATEWDFDLPTNMKPTYQLINGADNEK